MHGSSMSSSRSTGTDVPRSSAWSRPRTGISRGETLPEIAGCLEELVAFYPRHIEKEDKHFFYPILDYFSAAEQDAMLREFNEFDRRTSTRNTGRLWRRRAAARWPDRDGEGIV